METIAFMGTIFKMVDVNADDGQSYKYLIRCPKNIYFDTNITALGDIVLKILVKLPPSLKMADVNVRQGQK